MEHAGDTAIEVGTLGGHAGEAAEGDRAPGERADEVVGHAGTVGEVDAAAEVGE